jgi:hypothetical protein
MNNNFLPYQLKKNAEQANNLASQLSQIAKQEVNPLKYGAVGDGTVRPISSSDLTKINTLVSMSLYAYDPFNEGGAYLPHTTKNGVALQTSDITITDQGGNPYTNFTVAQQGNMTVLTFGSQSMAVTISYTADKFNVGDDWDTVGLQLAVDSLNVTDQNYPDLLGTQGGTVRIPKGRFNITKPIIVPSNGYIQLVGSGKASTSLFAIVKCSSLVLFTGGSHGGISKLTLDGNIDGSGNMQAGDLLVVTNRSNFFVAEKLRLNVANRYGLYVKDLVIFSSFRDINISRCDVGVKLVHGINQCVFESIRVEQSRTDGWWMNGDTYNCYNLSFINCITEYNGNGYVGNTTTPSPVAKAIDGMEIHSINGATFIGCYFENNGSGLQPSSVDVNNPPCAVKLIGKDIAHLYNENITFLNCMFSAHYLNIYARNSRQIEIDSCNFTTNMVQDGHPVWSTYPSKSFDFGSDYRFPIRIKNCQFYSDISGYSLASGVYLNWENTGISNYANNFRTPNFRTTLMNPETSADNGTFTIGDINNNNLIQVSQNSGYTTTTFRNTNHSVILPSFVQFNTNFLKYANAAPTTGTWSQGDIVFNTAVAAGGKVGWVCTTAGTPGTWKAFGAVDA